MKKNKATKVKTKLYYDACALDSDKYAYSDILSTSGTSEAVVSHLSLGEAYGNCFKKGKKAAARNSFTGLIEKLIEAGYLKIVGNDHIEEILEATCTAFPRLTLTDAVHLATAINSGCLVFKTADADLSGLPKAKLKQLGSQFGLNELRTENVKL